jgi:predicted branched-subunit amino acid permease
MATTMSETHTSDVREGVRAGLGWIPALAPYGFVVGITVEASTIPALVGWATGPLLLGGSAQIALIQLLDAGAAPVLALLAILAVNARLVLYGAVLAGRWRDTSIGFRALAAYFVVEPTFAIASDRYAGGESRGAHHHYLAASGVIWLAWQLAIGAGIVLGGVVPAALGLGAIVPIFLVADVAPRLRSAPTIAAAGVAGAVAVLTRGLPHHSGLVIAIAAGVAVAVAIGEGRR